MSKKCPECSENEQVVKNGKYKYKDKYVQRFICKKCRTVFQDKNYAFKNKKEKELAMALYNLLNIKPTGAESNNLDLSELLLNREINETLSIKIKNAEGNGRLPFNCNTPKILLCLGEEDNIEIICLPDYIKKTYKVVII